MRAVGSLVSELTYLDCDAFDDAALHRFLGDALVRCGTIGHLLQQHYALL
jgi:hypothetical protein